MHFIKTEFREPKEVSVAYFPWRHVSLPFGVVEMRDGKSYLMDTGEEIDIETCSEEG